jgi:hypothetical protein
MVLHLTHTEGGFGVTFNDVTKYVVFYTTTSHFVTGLGVFSQERQVLWLSEDDLRDSSSWSSPPFMFRRDIHSKLLSQYDFKEVSAPSQSQVNTGTGDRYSAQDGVSQQQEVSPLSIPNLTVSDDPSLTDFRDLKLMFVGSRRDVQLTLCSQQRIVATVEDSVLRTEMVVLESQEFHHHGRPDPSDCGEAPRGLQCGCRKFQRDPLDDHLYTSTTRSGAKKTHDWSVDQLADLFRTTHKAKTQQVTRRAGVNPDHPTLMQCQASWNTNLPRKGHETSNRERHRGSREPRIPRSPLRSRNTRIV